MSDGVDDGLVHHIDVIAAFAGSRACLLHEPCDERGSRVDLVGGGAGEAFNVRYMVGRELRAGVAGGFDGAGW